MSAAELLRADERPRGARGIEYRRAWAFKGEATRRLWEAQLRGVPRPILHVCAGGSRLGDLRVDLAHPAADVRADGRTLPVRDAVFGTVIMDPPWALLYPDRLALITEAGRVPREGGVFLLYAPWMPAPSWADLEDVAVRHQRAHRWPEAPVVLTRWRVRPRRKNARDAELRRRGRDDACA